jgi:hypothetical protein
MKFMRNNVMHDFTPISLHLNPKMFSSEQAREI